MVNVRTPEVATPVASIATHGDAFHPRDESRIQSPALRAQSLAPCATARRQAKRPPATPHAPGGPTQLRRTAEVPQGAAALREQSHGFNDRRILFLTIFGRAAPRFLLQRAGVRVSSVDSLGETVQGVMARLRNQVSPSAQEVDFRGLALRGGVLRDKRVELQDEGLGAEDIFLLAAGQGLVVRQKVAQPRDDGLERSSWMAVRSGARLSKSRLRILTIKPCLACAVLEANLKYSEEPKIVFALVGGLGHFVYVCVYVWWCVLCFVEALDSVRSPDAQLLEGGNLRSVCWGDASAHALSCTLGHCWLPLFGSRVGLCIRPSYAQAQQATELTIGAMLEMSGRACARHLGHGANRQLTSVVSQGGAYEGPMRNPTRDLGRGHAQCQGVQFKPSAYAPIPCTRCQGPTPYLAP